MKSSFISRIILLISVAIFFSNGCVPKKSHSNNDTVTSTGSSDCDLGINLFNKHAAGRVKNDIRLIYSYYGYIPGDLRQLYPTAKDAWNGALNDVRRNYTKNYNVTSLNGLTSEQIKDWRNKNLEDYQKFFLLLAEYRYGVYPKATNDMEKKIAWIEKADSKKRLDAYIEAAINSNCPSTNRDLIRQLLNPVLLPDRIEECYQ